MKLTIAALTAFLFTTIVNAQQAEDFFVEVEEITLANGPGVQSFAFAQHNGQWLIIGGRTDGLHRRQPWAAFDAADNNATIYVVDPANNNTFSTSLAGVTTSIIEQLQSTNMEFEQVDSTLYIVGGYGFSPTSNEHITYPYLTAVDVPGLIGAVTSGTSIVPYFRQIQDARVQVTGGVLDKVDSKYYLAGGQMFEGAYNPMGPDHGPGFVQQYTNSIKTFEIVDDGVNLSISNYNEWIDTMNLHRRDYNMVPQVFPDGVVGLTMFSGVFQYGADLPWLNTVDVRDTGFQVVPNFNQYLNQYHNAKMPVFDGTNNAMHTVFFGGISRYTMNSSGQLVDDPDVPFVKTISKVTRLSDASMIESKLDEMPGFLGSGAEFIPLESTSYFDHYEILQLDQLPYQRVLVGYIVGGIESSQANIFHINDGNQSDATTRVFEVYITRGISANVAQITGEQFFDAELYPNPANRHFTVKVSTPHETETTIWLSDLSGKRIKTLYEGNLTSDGIQLKVKTNDLSNGTYFVQIQSGDFRRTEKLIVGK